MLSAIVIVNSSFGNFLVFAFYPRRAWATVALRMKERRMSRALVATLAAALAAGAALPLWAETEWPQALRPFGGGFPKQGDPCSKVGETAATAEFLDDSAVLIACPASRSSVLVRRFLDTHGGRVVGEVEGFALISVGIHRGGDGSETLAGSMPQSAGEIPCTIRAGERAVRCPIGVTRKDRGTAIAKVTWPDGRSRSIFFANGRVTGADTNQADGSAKHRVVATKELDTFIVRIGAEHYEIPEALVLGH